MSYALSPISKLIAHSLLIPILVQKQHLWKGKKDKICNSNGIAKRKTKMDRLSPQKHSQLGPKHEHKLLLHKAAGMSFWRGVPLQNRVMQIFRRFRICFRFLAKQFGRLQFQFQLSSCTILLVGPSSQHLCSEGVQGERYHLLSVGMGG